LKWNAAAVGAAAILAVSLVSNDPVQAKFNQIPERKYVIIAGPGQEQRAHQLVASDPERFTYYPTRWDKFPDGTDHIIVGGFSPVNQIQGNSVVFLACFSSNDSTLSQLHALHMLSESFVESLTVVLPFYPTGTMERVDREGEIATGISIHPLT
jgi:hypothetical protein